MEPKNLLILMADEQNRDMLGAYGHSVVQTPNIDRLAARGTRFSAAYTNSPICVPARAAFQSGRYAHETGYWDNAIAYDGQVPGWGHALQRNGLRSRSIGKLHYRAADDPLGFDESELPIYLKDGVGSVLSAVRDPLPALTEDAHTKPGFAAEAGPGLSTYNSFDAAVGERAVDWLHEVAKSEDDSPWVTFVSFLAPHYPLIVPERFFAMYPVDEMPAPRLLPEAGYPLHPWVQVLSDYQPHANALTPELSRRAMAAYFGLCSYVDELIGQVLTALEETGLAASTRVIYTSDHGEMAGARGLWGKSVLYEDSTAVPLILAGPDVPEAVRCDTPVSLVDIYPTVLHAVGVRPNEDERLLPGDSLFDIAVNAPQLDRPVFSEYHAAASPSGGFMLRRGRYKYCCYAGGYPPELFDLTEDPDEVNNLASDPKFASVCAELDTALRAIVDPDTADRKAKDAQNAVVSRFGGRDKVIAEKIGGGSFTRVPDAIAKKL